MRTCPSQLRLVELRQSLRAGGVGDAEDVVYRIITVLVLHQLAIEKALYLYGCLNNPLFQNNISSIPKIESKSIVARRYKRNIFGIYSHLL